MVLDPGYKEFLCRFYSDAIVGVLSGWIRDPEKRNRAAVMSYLTATIRNSLAGIFTGGAYQEDARQGGSCSDLVSGAVSHIGQFRTLWVVSERHRPFRRPFVFLGQESSLVLLTEPLRAGHGHRDRLRLVGEVEYGGDPLLPAGAEEGIDTFFLLVAVQPLVALRVMVPLPQRGVVQVDVVQLCGEAVERVMDGVSVSYKAHHGASFFRFSATSYSDSHCSMDGFFRVGSGLLFFLLIATS